VKESRVPDDPDLAGLQKFMVLHGDLHDVWERLLEDPEASLLVEGEDVAVHLAMDLSTERALEQDRPEGLRRIYSSMVATGLDAGQAFHVLSQAMMHEFVSAAEAGQTMDLAAFMRRAALYAGEAMKEGIGGENRA
jgi:hypothetical protein